MIRRPLSPPATTATTPTRSTPSRSSSALKTVIQRFKADPTSIPLLEELLRASRTDVFRWEMNDSDMFMHLATQLILDVQTYGFQSNRESLQRREYYLKGLTNSCFQNERVKEALASNQQFLGILAGMLESNFELVGDVCDLIKNIAFNINHMFHASLSAFVPKLCGLLSHLSEKQHNHPQQLVQCEQFAKTALNALWNLVAQSKQNRTWICENSQALYVIIQPIWWREPAYCHEEVSSVLRCIRGTMFSNYQQLEQMFAWVDFIRWLYYLISSANSNCAENGLLLLKDFIDVEPRIAYDLRQPESQGIVNLLRGSLINSWVPQISQTAKQILEEQIGVQNDAFLEEEAETVVTEKWFDEDFEEDFQPPLPDPLTPAAQLQYEQISYELIDLPLLELSTPKRAK